MSEQQYSDVVNTAREYYNSEDADNFYYHVWGGEDIHIGLYEDAEKDTIAEASRRADESLAAHLDLKPGDKVLDIGAGYGGAARYLARRFGCDVVALNLSEKENERDRQMNREQGLDDKIEVVDGSFEDIPFPDNTFDAVWSQEAILHSGERDKVVKEAARVLKPGGLFVFSDIMQAENVSREALQPIFDRIHLSTLGSLPFYRKAAADAGLEELGYEDQTRHLPIHYARVHDELERMADELKGKVSDEYVERMKIGLQHWVNGGKQGHLVWGALRFRKPA